MFRVQHFDASFQWFLQMNLNSLHCNLCNYCINWCKVCATSEWFRASQKEEQDSGGLQTYPPCYEWFNLRVKMLGSTLIPSSNIPKRWQESSSRGTTFPLLPIQYLPFLLTDFNEGGLHYPLVTST